MEILIFAGPSLSAQDGREELGAVYLPPVSQGDVHGATRWRPWGIGIVDGYFERVPAVCHKEILWALSQGIHVFGAASMGALRAVELEPFGMEGVGRVFEAFRSGELEADDEVAVVHGPPETGYQALSEPMVNIRFTLAKAGDAGIIRQATRQDLLGIGKRLFYADRTYPTLLGRAAAQGLPAAELRALARWLPGNRVDQKRLDALALLRRMREAREAMPGSKRVRFRFRHTDAWEQLRLDAVHQSLGRRETADLASGALLDELRLEGGTCREVRLQALVRALALRAAELDSAEASERSLHEVIDAFRRVHGLSTADEVDRWLDEQGTDGDELARLLRDEARFRRTLALAEAGLEGHLADQLRLSGQHGRLARRARDKERVLALHGLDNPTLADTGLGEEELWRWYFGKRLRVPVPDTLADYARALGMEDEGALRRAVCREFCYTRLASEEASAGCRSARSPPLRSRSGGG